MIEFALIFANPQGTQPLDLSTEVQTIRSKLRADQRTSFLKLHLVRDASPSAIEDALKVRPHLVHFGGHGYRTSLGVAGDNNQLHRMPKAALSQWIDVLSKRTRIVVLNACHSIEDAEPFLSAVECVIGMRAAISDPAALGFASSFYSALGDGRSVAEAFASGKAGLVASGVKEADMPVLKPREGIDAADIRLFRPIKTVSVSADCSTDRDLAIELQKTLFPLSRLGVIEYASVAAVPVGASRTQYIEDQLQNAEVLLPLLSRDLTNDQDLLEAMGESMRRDKQLVIAPLMLRACDISTTPFAGLQVIPRTGIVDGKRIDRDAAWLTVTHEIHALIERLLTAWNQREHAEQMAKAAASSPMPNERTEGTDPSQGQVIPKSANATVSSSAAATSLTTPSGKLPPDRPCAQ